MNVSKTINIHNMIQSCILLSGGRTNFQSILVEGIKPVRKHIVCYVQRFLMLATALGPVIGPDKASEIANHVLNHGLPCGGPL